MKKIVCELCGGNQLYKKDGYFQCEFCGTKYSLEEAKKLIGKVEIMGDVSVKSADFIIRAGKLEKYNGSQVNVVIPDSVSVIGEGAFKGCSGLLSVSFPDSIRRIERSAFEGCSGLTSITIPESVGVIESFAFKGCRSLSNVTIPAGVVVDRDSAFDGTKYWNELDRMYRERRRNELCQYCGSPFKGVFRKVCSNPSCNKEKDY